MMHAVLHLFHFANNACGTNTGVFPSLYDAGPGLTCNGNQPTIANVQGFFTVLGNLARILIALSGGLAVIAIIAGGIVWIISGGDPGRIKMGRDIITNAVVGLIVIIAAYAVVTFIAKGF